MIIGSTVPLELKKPNSAYHAVLREHVRFYVVREATEEEFRQHIETSPTRGQQLKNLNSGKFRYFYYIITD